MGKSKTKKLSEDDSLKETMKAVTSFEKRRSQKFRDSSSDSSETNEILTQSTQKRKRKSSSSSSSSEDEKPKMKKPAIFTVSMKKKGSSKHGSFLKDSSDSSSDEELPKTIKSSKQLFPEKSKKSKKYSSSSSDSSDDNRKKSKIKSPPVKPKFSKSFAESSDDDSDSSEDEKAKIKQAKKTIATTKSQKSFNDSDSSSDDNEIVNKIQSPSKKSKTFKSPLSKKKREESSDSDTEVVQNRLIQQSSSATDSSDDEKGASSKKDTKLIKKVGDISKSSLISPKKKQSPVKSNVDIETSSDSDSESDKKIVNKSMTSTREEVSDSPESEEESEKHVSFLETEDKEKNMTVKKEMKEKKTSPKKMKDSASNLTSPKVKSKPIGQGTPDISKKKMTALQRQTMHFYEDKPMAVTEDIHFSEVMKPTASSGKTLLCISLPKGFDVRVLNGQTLHLPGRDIVDEKKQTTKKIPGSNWQFDVIPLDPSEAPNVLVKNKKAPGFTITPPISYLVDVRKKLTERAKTTADKPQPKKIKKEVPKDLKMRNVVKEKESKSPKKKGDFVSSTPVNGKVNKPDEEILKLSSISKSKRSYPSEEECDKILKKEKKKKRKAKESISSN